MHRTNGKASHNGYLFQKLFSKRTIDQNVQQMTRLMQCTSLPFDTMYVVSMCGTCVKHVCTRCRTLFLTSVCTWARECARHIAHGQQMSEILRFPENRRFRQNLDFWPKVEILAISAIFWIFQDFQDFAVRSRFPDGPGPSRQSDQVCPEVAPDSHLAGPRWAGPERTCRSGRNLSGWLSGPGI